MTGNSCTARLLLLRRGWLSDSGSAHGKMHATAAAIELKKNNNNNNNNKQATSLLRKATTHKAEAVIFCFASWPEIA